MRIAFTVVVFLVALLIAGTLTAEPIYLDAMMEMQLAELQKDFPNLRKEGCYRIGADRFLLIEIEKKDQKPSRIILSSVAPCRRPEDTAVALDVRHRKEIDLGSKSLEVLEKMKRPDASAPPDGALRKLGDTEYFYICRVSEGCARHTSVFMRDGVVSAISEWYSE